MNSERSWIAPDGTEFEVPDTHQNWIANNQTILDKYKVGKEDRIRKGLMRIGWIRIKKGKWNETNKGYRYIEVQFNFKCPESWVIADKYIREYPNLELLIANHDERLMNIKDYTTMKKILSSIARTKMQLFLKRYKNAINNQII